MTQTITEEVVQALPSDQLAIVAAWIRAEEKTRAEKHKQQTVAKIRELARSIEVDVKIEGTRGRPAGSKKQHQG